MVFSAAEVLEAAVRIEQNGEAFYRGAAEKMKAGAARDTFGCLAIEEARHRRMFLEILVNLEDPEKPLEPIGDYQVEYQGFMRVYADSQLFTKTDAVQKEMKKIKSIAQALEFALKVELDSVYFYSELRRFVSSGQVDVVDQIIREERGHYVKLAALRTEIPPKGSWYTQLG